MNNQNKLFLTVFLASGTALAKENSVTFNGEIKRSGRPISSLMAHLAAQSQASAHKGFSTMTQRPYAVDSTIADDPKIVLKLAATPTQSSDYILLRVSELKPNMYVSMYNQHGKIVSEKSISDVENKIQIDKYGVGSYTLLISDQDRDLKTFRIIKRS